MSTLSGEGQRPSWRTARPGPSVPVAQGERVGVRTLRSADRDVICALPGESAIGLFFITCFGRESWAATSKAKRRVAGAMDSQLLYEGARVLCEKCFPGEDTTNKAKAAEAVVSAREVTRAMSPTVCSRAEGRPAHYPSSDDGVPHRKR